MRALAFGAFAAALLSGCAANTARPQSVAAAAPADEVFYHIFNRSMRDSNGDGEGDLQGIIDSLDYLKRLGVTSILLTPLYPSAFYHNYFASDFEGVDPEYGTMTDYARLVEAVHARGMKIYLDQEIQYVAYDHDWYAKSLGNPASPYTDFLIWRGPGNMTPEEGPFGITIAPRFLDAKTGITTVNMKSPAVKAYFQDYFLRWVDPDGDGDFSDGVDGFRLDHMMDDLDEKGILTGLFDDFWKPLFARVRSINPDILFVAEQADWGYGGDFLKRGDTDFAFAFPLAAAIRSFDKAKIVEAIAGTAAATPPGKHQIIFVENHDMNRVASDPGMTPERLRTAAALATLLKGTPLLYYGQEIGMRGLQRPEYKTDEKDIGTREAFEWEAKADAPVHADWYRGAKTYWTEKFARDGDGISVAEQQGDPASLLSYYQRLLRLRREHPALARGDQRVLESTAGILVVERALGGERLLIVTNLSAAPVDYPAPSADLLGGEGDAALGPYQTAVFKAP